MAGDASVNQLVVGGVRRVRQLHSGLAQRVDRLQQFARTQGDVLDALAVVALQVLAVHFAPLPYNAFLLASLWRHPQPAVALKWVGLGWFAAMLVV